MAIQVTQPHSPAPTVRTQSADTANGLLRYARSCDFTSIEIARALARGNPSDSAAQSSPNRQDSVRRYRQWTVSLRSQFRFYPIEIARALARSNPSEPAAKSSPDRQDSVYWFYQWTATSGYRPPRSFGIIFSPLSHRNREGVSPWQSK